MIMSTAVTKDQERSANRHSTLMTSSQTQESPSQSSPTNQNGPLTTADSIMTASSITTGNSVVSSGGSVSGGLGSGRSPSYFGDSSGQIFLREGLQVLCNNELGLIRYIGETEFADGVWVGVELRHSNGRNDGAVRGRRYFTCEVDHGVMVRPSKVTVRGINGANLLPPELSDVNDNALLSASKFSGQ